MSEDVFPVMTTTCSDDWSGDTPFRFHPQGGLTKRELFSALIFPAMIRNPGELTMGADDMFVATVRAADALIAALAEEKAP